MEGLNWDTQFIALTEGANRLNDIHNEHQKRSKLNFQQITKELGMSDDQLNNMEYNLNGKPIINLLQYKNLIRRYCIPHIQCPIKVFSIFLLMNIPEVIQYPINENLYQRLEALLDQRILRIRQRKKKKSSAQISLSLNEVQPGNFFLWLKSYFSLTDELMNELGPTEHNKINIKEDDSIKWIAMCKSPSEFFNYSNSHTVTDNAMMAFILGQWFRLTDIKFELELKVHQRLTKKKQKALTEELSESQADVSS